MSFSNEYVNPMPTVTSYQRFPSEYFSGANISVYFDDIWVDEVQSITFSLQENVQPIHGYASYTADAFAHGSRTVQGQLAVNFKAPHYIISTIRELELRKRDTSVHGRTFDSGMAYGNIQQSTARVTPEDLISKNYTDETWGQIAQQMQSRIWGTEQGPAAAVGEKLVSNPHDLYFYRQWEGRASQLRDTGINIVITYGNINNVHDHLFMDGGTMLTITGVHFTGVAQAIGPNAEPIAEQYSFIAKDLNGPIIR